MHLADGIVDDAAAAAGSGRRATEKRTRR